MTLSKALSALLRISPREALAKEDATINTCCSGCEQATPNVTFLLTKEVTIPTDQRIVPVSIAFCNECSLSLKDSFPDIFSNPAQKPATSEPTNESIKMTCSFCEHDQFQRRAIFALCRYYVTHNGKNGAIVHRVTHDELFLAANSENSPKRVAEICICNNCAL